MSGSGTIQVKQHHMLMEQCAFKM